ncbi:hypothetical protein [Frigidibacter sp. MR17.24]|uniref:hypothetical protein n=1 Tax=Frigidibacter sp. MR17.24 TaxID=3127345 RepID=UPI0030129DD2
MERMMGNHLTLAEIAAKFARMDGVEDDRHAPYEKALRNLVSRHFLPPTTQQGRVFLYDSAASLAIRLGQIASDFGLPRTSVDTLTRWLSASGDRKLELPEGGLMGLSHAEEAIQRAKSGEAFNVHLIMRADRSVIVQQDWVSDRAVDDQRNARMRAALKSLGHDAGPEIARFSLPASRIITEMLPVLGED